MKIPFFGRRKNNNVVTQSTRPINLNYIRDSVRELQDYHNNTLTQFIRELKDRLPHLNDREIQDFFTNFCGALEHELNLVERLVTYLINQNQGHAKIVALLQTYDFVGFHRGGGKRRQDILNYCRQLQKECLDETTNYRYQIESAPAFKKIKEYVELFTSAIKMGLELLGEEI
jgi:hypothetical protein